MKTSEKNNQVILIDKLPNKQQYIVKDNEEKTFLIYLSDPQNQTGKIEIIIVGRHAKVQILGIILGSGNQVLNMYTLQDHQKESSISDLLVKSVLFDSARFNYEGLIKIEKNAQKSNAYQKNQNLLMSEKAWAESKPKLEILANDVRCTHGATIGKIREDELYYLATRGLSKSTATQILIGGFFQEIIARVPDQKLQQKVRKVIHSKLSQLLAN